MRRGVFHFPSASLVNVSSFFVVVFVRSSTARPDYDGKRRLAAICHHPAQQMTEPCARAAHAALNAPLGEYIEHSRPLAATPQ